MKPSVPSSRFSFVANLQSRDGGVTKDARMHNAFVEKEGDVVRTWQRPGLGSGVSGSGGGHGLMNIGDTVYSFVGSTMNAISPAFSISIQTSTVAAGYAAPYGGFIYRINFVNGAVYRAAPSGTLSWQLVSTAGMIANPAANNLSVADGIGYIWAKASQNGADYNVFRSQNGFTWGTLGVAGANDVLAGFNNAVWKLNALGTGQPWEYYNTAGSSVTGTLPPHAFSMNPIAQMGSGGGYLWALGTTVTASNTAVMLAQTPNGTSWTIVGTGTGEFPPSVVSRMAYFGGKMNVVEGTGGSGKIISLRANQTWGTLGTFGSISSNYRALIPASKLYLLGNNQLNGYQSQLGASGTLVSSPVSGVTVNPSVIPIGLTRSSNGNTIVMQGTDGVTLYDILAGTSGSVTGANFPALMVPGIAYLDATYYVMEPDGSIWNSAAAADDPTTWPTDGLITAEFEPDEGVCLTKALNNVVALSKWSTQLFWDAANPTGSPLLPVTNGVILIGCASAGSVVQLESSIIWIAQRKGQGSTAQTGRFVAMLVGNSYEEISTPAVGRILDADDLSSVYAAVIELGGHTWYILGLTASNITLVFDLKNKIWYTWSRLGVGSPVTISSLIMTNGLVTATASLHLFSDGDPVNISGITPPSDTYGGTRNISIVDANTFNYPIPGVSTGTSTFTGTMVATPWTESAFNVMAVAGVGSLQLVQDTDGNVFTFSLSQRTDLGINPIDVRLRTNNLDNGNQERKFCHAVAVMGDVLASVDYGLLRYTDDDYRTYKKYRRFDLSQTQNHEKRFGYYTRRAWEWRYTGTSQFRLQYLEPDLTQGAT